MTAVTFHAGHKQRKMYSRFMRLKPTTPVTVKQGTIGLKKKKKDAYLHSGLVSRLMTQQANFKRTLLLRHSEEMAPSL